MLDPKNNFFLDANVALDNPTLNPPKVVRDPRIRHEYGSYRIVAPRGQLKANGVFYCNGPLVLERARRDSLGALTWTFVADFPKEINSPELDEGLYTILAAGAGDAK